MKIFRYLMIAFGALVFFTQNAHALTSCQLPAGLPKVYNVPLAPLNITVGPDMPVGTVVYRLNFNHPQINGFLCPPGEQFNLPQRLDYISLPMPLSSWNGTPFPGKVYNTSVPGIGVVAWSDINNQALPTVAYTTSNVNSFYVSINVVLSFIKIGPVTPGVITASSLPSVFLEFAPDPTLTGMPQRIYNLSYSGSINVVSQTCTTPDVNVPLGSYETSTFTSKGTVTAWRDASIELKDCPRFYGYYNNTSYNTSVGAGSTTAGTAVPNLLTAKITPQNTVWDTARGIMNVTSSTSSATGVGIQLGWGDSSGSPQPLNFNQNFNFNPGNNALKSFKIPLSARYYQTGDTVTPGRADGKVTFTISYY
ncbi:fimbrial protein [Serratia fonticola]|uniref:fimbrial protein n=1 Tax=Serratia fonticola TaxID=47917 RepID=UPI000BA1CEBE|nr:fimbrial protein [Serratia fonticola]PAA94960.1 hypothetical protein CJJ13_24720 [Serratia fonticola]